MYTRRQMQAKLTVQEVADKLKVSERTVLREIKRGNIEPEKIGRRYLISQEELDRFLGKGVQKNIQAEIRTFLENKKGEMIDDLQRFVSIPTHSDNFQNEAQLAEAINRIFTDHKVRSFVYTEDRVIAIKATLGYKDRGILLNCPLYTEPPGDEIEWDYPPFEGVIEEGKMFGRGALQAKGGIVAMVYAVLALKKYLSEEEIRVEIVFDGGQDKGLFHGLNKINDAGLPVDLALLGLNTSPNKIINGTTGFHRYKVTVKPSLVKPGGIFKSGFNAINSMANFINNLNEVTFPPTNHSEFSESTKLRVSKIRSNKTVNSFPIECEAELYFSTAPDITREILDEIMNALTTQQSINGSKFEFEYLSGREGYIISREEKSVKILKEILERSRSDQVEISVDTLEHAGTLLNEQNIPVLVYGPWGENVNSYNECVELDSLPEVSNIYASFVIKYFGV